MQLFLSSHSNSIQVNFSF